MKKIVYHIQNLKCGGCATQITSKLSKIEGISSVSVDENASSIGIECEEGTDLDKLVQTLRRMGYPLIEEDNSFGGVAKSYMSCVIGRVKEKVASK